MDFEYDKTFLKLMVSDFFHFMLSARRRLKPISRGKNFFKNSPQGGRRRSKFEKIKKMISKLAPTWDYNSTSCWCFQNPWAFSSNFWNSTPGSHRTCKFKLTKNFTWLNCLQNENDSKKNPQVTQLALRKRSKWKIVIKASAYVNVLRIFKLF